MYSPVSFYTVYTCVTTTTQVYGEKLLDPLDASLCLSHSLPLWSLSRQYHSFPLGINGHFFTVLSVC